MRRSHSILGLLAWVSASVVARAELYTYTITQSQSQISLTAGGSFLDGALTVTEQNPAAITRYNGTIGVDTAMGC